LHKSHTWITAILTNYCNIDIRYETHNSCCTAGHSPHNTRQKQKQTARTRVCNRQDCAKRKQCNVKDNECLKTRVCGTDYDVGHDQRQNVIPTLEIYRQYRTGGKKCNIEYYKGPSSLRPKPADRTPYISAGRYSMGTLEDPSAENKSPIDIAPFNTESSYCIFTSIRIDGRGGLNSLFIFSFFWVF